MSSQSSATDNWNEFHGFRWYISQSVPFFLFGPTLTLLGLMKRPERKEKICVVLIGNGITYENGAEVQTSYVTNMDTYAVRMGHSDFSTTANIYAHLDYQSKVTSAEAMLAGLGLKAAGIEPLSE